jgi:hypothetical protein
MDDRVSFFELYAEESMRELLVPLLKEIASPVDVLSCRL